MLTFIQMEFLKLKRSKIFLLSVLMAALPALLMYIATFAFDEVQAFDALFTNVNMYMSVLFAVLLFSIIMAYLFGREYNEHTLKAMLTVPISRGKFLVSKYLMFLIWILILTVVTSVTTLVFGFAAGLTGFTLKLFIDSFAQLLLANVLLFLTFYFIICYKYGSCNGWWSKLNLGEYVGLWTNLGAVCSLGMSLFDCIR